MEYVSSPTAYCTVLPSSVALSATKVRPFFRRIISAGHKEAASRTPHNNGMRMRAEFISNSGRSIVTKVLPQVALILLLLAAAAGGEDAAPPSATTLYRQLSS